MGLTYSYVAYKLIDTMVHFLKVTNFYSVGQEVILDFVLTGKTPKNLVHHKSASGVKISVIEVMIGPNASGKTTALRALSLIKLLMTEMQSAEAGCQKCDNDYLPFKPFALNRKKSNSLLEVRFENNKAVYDYRCSLNKDRIASEELWVKDYSKKRVVTNLLFSRKWIKNKYAVIDNFKLDLPERYLEANSTSKTTVISLGAHLGHQSSQEISNYWQKIETNVDNEFRWSHISRSYRAYRALKHYERNEEDRLDVQKILKLYDLGIEGLDKKGYIKHKYNNKFFKLRVHEESSGTQQLFLMLRLFDNVLSEGSVAIIDEFDTYLHPEMIGSLVKRFISSRNNKHKAQLIISTHNPEILNDLSREQVTLAVKNRSGSTVLKRIDTLKESRSDDNLHNQYLARRYGGIPDIKDNNGLTKE